MPSNSKEGSLCMENTCPDPLTMYCYCHQRKQKIEQDDWGNADPALRENLSSVSCGLLSGVDTWLAEQHRELLPGSHTAAHKGRVIKLSRQTRAEDMGQGTHVQIPLACALNLSPALCYYNPAWWHFARSFPLSLTGIATFPWSVLPKTGSHSPWALRNDAQIQQNELNLAPSSSHSWVGLVDLRHMCIPSPPPQPQPSYSKVSACRELHLPWWRDFEDFHIYSLGSISQVDEKNSSESNLKEN